MRKKHWMLSPWFIIFAAVMLLMTTISANYNMAVFYTELGVTIAATAVVFVLSLRFSAYIRLYENMYRHAPAYQAALDAAAQKTEEE